MKLILPALALLVASTATSAQQSATTVNKPTVQRRCCVHRSPRRVISKTVTTAPQLLTPPSAEFYVGEAKVDVTKDETVVRLAMAQHGSVLIELPANDGPRYIIPGDPEMATVDEKALERNKRAIVVRPGTLFVSPAPNRKTRTPAATVTAQMRSGLVVTFLFYPVEDLAQNVHRCVLSYNRDEVVARRRAAGLPVNLDTNIQERRNETGQSTAPTSISVETSEDDKPSEREPSDRSATLVPTEKDPKPKGEVNDKSTSLPLIANPASLNIARKTETNERLSAFAREALTKAIKKPKQFKGWTKPAHGLALASVQQADPKEDLRLVIIAVRNTSAEALKLTSGSPDIFVEMLDDQGKAINIEPIKKLHTEASDAAGAISAGTTVYYAIAYVSPVLGVYQQVKVVVGQTSAADEPASITLASNKR